MAKLARRLGAERGWPRRPLVLLWCVALAVYWLATPRLAFSQNGPDLATNELRDDYQTTNKRWNGLATFAALAQGAGLTVSERSRVDWSELDSDDLVLLIYPTSFIDPHRVVEFIRNGGRVLIADDFGNTDLLLKELGAHRGVSVTASSYYDNRLFAPTATPNGKHPLSHGVVELTSNHPSALRDLAGMASIFQFEQGATLVAAGQLGQGTYVVLADPSVLINRMLQFEGNLQFAINLLRFLSRPGESDRVFVLTGDVDVRGVPSNLYDDGTWRGAASGWFATIEGWFAELNTYYWSPKGLFVTTIILVILCSFFAFFILPRRRKQPLTGDWTHAGRDHRADVLTSLLTRYQGRESSYLLPASIERDNLNAAIEELIKQPDPLHEMKEADLLRVIGETGGPHLAEIAGNLLPHLRQLPQRAQAAAHWQPRYLSRNDFETLHSLSEEFFHALEARPKAAW